MSYYFIVATAGQDTTSSTTADADRHQARRIARRGALGSGAATVTFRPPIEQSALP
jgi:hypothetical protein